MQQDHLDPLQTVGRGKGETVQDQAFKSDVGPYYTLISTVLREFRIR